MARVSVVIMENSGTHSDSEKNASMPSEPTTFMFRDYNPYIGGLKPSFFLGFGVQRVYTVQGRFEGICSWKVL